MGEREGKSAVLFKGSLGLSKNKNAYLMTNLISHEYAFEEKFYCGYDPTADSLHLGHFLTFMAAVNFMKRGNTFVMLIGGATGMI